MDLGTGLTVRKAGRTQTLGPFMNVRDLQDLSLPWPGTLLVSSGRFSGCGQVRVL